MIVIFEFMEKEVEEKKDKTEKKLKKEKEKGEKLGPFSYFIELLKVFVWALIIIIPIRTFLFQPFFVQGASMEPSFYDKEYLIINELGYKETNVGVGDKTFFSVKPSKELKRSDVVVFRYPKNPNDFFIKRIIGLPGEKVEIDSGKVKIYNQENPNGFILDEKDYLPSVQNTDCVNCVFQLSDGEYFVLGDNRSHSSDSRTWGPLSKEHVIGKVLLRAWPINEFNIF